MLKKFVTFIFPFFLFLIFEWNVTQGLVMWRSPTRIWDQKPNILSAFSLWEVSFRGQGSTLALPKGEVLPERRDPHHHSGTGFNSFLLMENEHSIRAIQTRLNHETKSDDPIFRQINKLSVVMWERFP